MRQRLLILLLALLLWPMAARAEPAFPALSGRVVDDAALLTLENRALLNDTLQRHEQMTGEQFVVVTVPDLQGMPIEDFGYQLGRHWGIGQKGRDNGALLIVAPNDRQTRLEIGYGLEDRLTDAASALIINRVMLPAFRAGDFNKGIVEGTQAALSVLGGTTSEQLAAQLPPNEDQDDPLPWPVIVLLILFYFMIVRSRRSGSVMGPIILGSTLGRSSRRGGFGGGGFRGSGGGFGGGGASGRW